MNYRHERMIEPRYLSSDVQILPGYYRSRIKPPGSHAGRHITLYVKFYKHRGLANELLVNQPYGDAELRGSTAQMHQMFSTRQSPEVLKYRNRKL